MPSSPWHRLERRARESTSRKRSRIRPNRKLRTPAREQSEMKTIFSMGQLFALTGTIGLLGCATQQPPQDLVNARAAYVRADNSNAAQLDQAGMHAAKQQLEVAEASFEENGDTQDTRDQSYLSVRKTELAESTARTMQSKSSR